MKTVFTILLTIFFLQSHGQFGLVKADRLKEWEIDEYFITYSRKLGPAGPEYYEYDIYKNNKYLSYAAYLVDSSNCKLLFRERNDHYVTFDLCSKTKIILSAKKNELELTEIDSITIRPYNSIRIKPRAGYTAPFFDTVITKNFDSTITKKLTAAQAREFIKRWNNSKVNGFQRLGKGYDYLIAVYTKGTARHFITLNYFITENELWSFKTKEDKFFDKLWGYQ